MRRRRLVVALVLASALAVFAAAEIGLRVLVLPRYWRPLPPFEAVMTASQREWLWRERAELDGRVPPTDIGVFDAELGWAHRPGSVSPEHYRVHPGGWRGTRDYSTPPPPGVVRLAAFGESFTFCNEVPDADSWEAQLEALDPRFEAVNFGVGGYGTDQALLLAERELGRLHAELVVVGLMLENIGRNVTRYRPLWVPDSFVPAAKPRFVLESGALRLVTLPFRDREELVRSIETGTVLERLSENEHWSRGAMPELLRWSALARLVNARRVYATHDVARLWSRPGEPFEVTLALLDRFRTLARAQGASDALVLVFPARPDLEFWLEHREKYWSRLLDALAQRDAPVFDLCDALAAGHAAGKRNLYAPGGHLTRTGNALVAEALLGWLREHYPER